MLQKWVRGHLVRREMQRKQEFQFKSIRKLRRMLSVGYGKLKQKLIKRLCSAMRDIATHLQHEQE